MEKKGAIFVLSGPSGAGKGTVLGGVKGQIDGFAVSVSVTTRAPRLGEREGFSYYFRSDQEFDKLIAENAFMEHVAKFGNRYGTLCCEVEKHIARGLDVVLEIETEGATKIKERYPESVLIFVTPSDPNALQERLNIRGTETAEQKELRLQIAKEEAKSVQKYDYIAINDDLDECVATVKAIILAERAKRIRFLTPLAN